MGDHSEAVSQVSEVGDRDGQRSIDAFWFFALLGSVVSAFAIVSLIVKAFAIGLSPIMLETLEYYRSVANFLFGGLLDALRWIMPTLSVPDWLKDVWALSFVGGAVGGRAFLLAEGTTPGRFVAAIACALIAGVTFAGLLVVVLWLAQILNPLPKGRLAGSPASRMRRVYGVALSIWAILLLTAAILDWRWLQVSLGYTTITSPNATNIVLLLGTITIIPLLLFLNSQIRVHEDTVRGIVSDDTFASKFSSNASVLMPLALLGAALFFAINAQAP